MTGPLVVVSGNCIGLYGASCERELVAFNSFSPRFYRHPVVCGVRTSDMVQQQRLQRAIQGKTGNGTE
ncbi:hypothetical protein C0U40_14255 [Amylibacter cionae]|nr:hypothetical protein C0U40_14255 [Amylibacter cionae]